MYQGSIVIHYEIQKRRLCRQGQARFRASDVQAGQDAGEGDWFDGGHDQVVREEGDVLRDPEPEDGKGGVLGG